MSARRIVLRRAYREQVPSRSARHAAERRAAKLGLPKLADRLTFAEWLRSKSQLITTA